MGDRLPHPEGVVEATLHDIANGFLDGAPLPDPSSIAWRDYVLQQLRDVYEYGRTGKQPPDTDGGPVLVLDACRTCGGSGAVETFDEGTAVQGGINEKPCPACRPGGEVSRG